MLSKYLLKVNIRMVPRNLSVRAWLGFFAGMMASIAFPAAAQIENNPLAHNGYSRPYLIYRPANLKPQPAVVLMLGGIRSTAKYTSENFGWLKEADVGGFVCVFPEPVATDPRQLPDRNNITFWEMKGSRTHRLGPGMLPVDDDGYLLAVLEDVFRRVHPDRRRIFLAGFSSGSGMVQLFASRHSKLVDGVVAVATPLMDPPPRLDRPVPILYIHGDMDEQLSGFEVNSPNFATTPHGNWVTWGYLNSCRAQTAEKTAWGVQFSWQRCKGNVSVVGDFVSKFGHEWAGSLDFLPDSEHQTSLDFTDMAWRFFSNVRSK
jgi:polyhydroxybutyrate depolymerase